MTPVASDAAPPSDIPSYTGSHRVCRQCGEVLPAVAFGDRQDGRCLRCGEMRRLEMRAAREQKEAAELMERLLSEARDPATSTPKLENLAGEIVMQFGGLHMLVKRFLDYLGRLEERDPPLTSVGHLYMGLFKLLSAASSAQHQEEIDRMNLEQVRRAQAIEAAKVLLSAANKESTKQRLLELINNSVTDDE